jgi:hypothetical protein
MVEDPEMEFTKVNLTKVQDYWQLAFPSREFFSDLRFPSTIGLGFGFLFHGIKEEKIGLLAFVCLFIFNFFIFFINYSCLILQTNKINIQKSC